MHDTIVRLADVWKTCNKIRAAAFRVGLNLWDWYRPLDPEGNSLISDAGGRDKTSSDCVLEACPPPPEPACHTLDQWQTRRLCCLLATIADRDLPLKPYFQDYELVGSLITFAHFARILNYIGVIVTADDFNLLVRKFIKDSYTIDYVEFLRAVDDVKKQGVQGLGPEYLNPSAVIDTTLPKLVRPEVEAGLSTAPLGFQETFHPALAQPRPPRQLIDLMLRVQEFVLQRRIRVSEFLRDYDPLNSGRIAPQQFRRALDAMGLGSILSQQEALCIMRHYLDPNDNQHVCWRTFEDDCDQAVYTNNPRTFRFILEDMLVYILYQNKCCVVTVFTIKELEKHPGAIAGSAREAVLELPPRGAAPDRSEGETVADLDAAQAALLRVRAACTERAIDLRPAFCEHDE
ncbi:hypothetical protein HF086_013898 [Spodoptera exigua]|uniref:EF-hand domain-containing protein n=1 Tax=Spodoptera exigua TaxID=7107 RepID=A0A922SG38_SPOEX|nr:hypothetical protein HF086_013898 [Spodoptera exigua]